MTFLRRHFPENRTKTKVYIKVFMPMVLGSIMFALNGFVDNFMVGHINQGQAALGAINSWTAILMGWFAGTAAAGSVLNGQFYFAKDYKTAQDVSKYRYYLCMIPTIILAIIAWTLPDTLTKVFVHNNDKIIFENAKIYSRVIAIQWILISITFNLGNQLREIGYGIYAMYWGIGTLLTNILLNSILMYGVKMGVDGAAWASVAGRLVALSTGIYAIITKKIKIGFNPFTIFNVSFETKKLFWKRWIYMFSVFTVTFFVVYRNSLYSLGYDKDSLGEGVSGISVVALTGALMNIFTTTFNALSSMSSRFVGSELGKGNFEQAKKNGDELKGLMTLISLFFSILMALFSLLVPYMSFLAKTQIGSNGNIIFDGSSQLRHVSLSLLVISLYYPVWIWFSTSYRIGNSGGKGSLFALVDWTISWIQLIWLWLIVAQIIPGWQYAENNFWVTYILFFSSDFLKMAGQEILYYKYKWLNKLTKKEEIKKEEIFQQQK